MKAEAGVRFVHARNPSEFLIGESVTRSTGRIHGAKTIGAPVDSYYEYLLKYWILGGKVDDHWKDRWVGSVDAALEKLKVSSKNGKYTLVGELPNARARQAEPVVGHLSCFYPGNVALGVMSGAVKGEKGDEYLQFAEDMMETCYQLYAQSRTGLGADTGWVDLEEEEFHLENERYFQRPEVVESLFYLWRYVAHPAE